MPWVGLLDPVVKIILTQKWWLRCMFRNVGNKLVQLVRFSRIVDCLPVI